MDAGWGGSTGNGFDRRWMGGGNMMTLNRVVMDGRDTLTGGSTADGMNRVRWDGSTADGWRRHGDFGSTGYGWRIDGEFNTSMANGLHGRRIGSIAMDRIDRRWISWIDGE